MAFSFQPPMRGAHTAAMKQRRADRRSAIQQGLVRSAPYRATAVIGAAAAAGALAPIVEADVRFHALVLARSGQPHCLQIWRTIAPRVRAHCSRGGP